MSYLLTAQGGKYGMMQVSYGFACEVCWRAYAARDGVNMPEARRAADQCCGTARPSKPEPILAGLDAWRDVLEERPPESVEVLIYDETAGDDAWQIARRKGPSWYVTGSARRWAPTHWRPLNRPEASS